MLEIYCDVIDYRKPAQDLFFKMQSIIFNVQAGDAERLQIQQNFDDVLLPLMS